MQRLFVAVRPPPLVRDHLAGLMGGVSGARWQDDDQLHLTLRFIGAVDRHAARDIDAALASVHHPAIDAAIRGLGAFDRRGVPATIWAGLMPAEPLRALHNKVEQAMARVGLEPDRRAFHPHITLARLSRGAGPVDDFLAGGGTVAGPTFRIQAFSLFESRLTPEGAAYAELERYPFA